MKLTINTRVDEDFRVVFSGFNETLFKKLAPPFPRLELLHFDGCKQGDQVEVMLNLLLFKQKWVSQITELCKNDYEIYFIDEGQVLPKPLRFWHHKHLFSKNGRQTLISDQVEYATTSPVLDYMLYPILYAQFAYRRPIYRQTFNRHKRLASEVV